MSVRSNGVPLLLVSAAISARAKAHSPAFVGKIHQFRANCITVRSSLIVVVGCSRRWLRQSAQKASTWGVLSNQPLSTAILKPEARRAPRLSNEFLNRPSARLKVRRDRLFYRRDPLLRRFPPSTLSARRSPAIPSGLA